MKTSTNISITDWNSFIAGHPNGTIFQSPEMFELFEKTDKYEPLVLGAFDEHETLCGILLGVFIHEKSGLGKLLSSRFVVYGGPVLSGNNKETVLDILLKALIEKTQKKALFIQFRNFFSWEEYLPVFEENGFGLLDRLNYIIQIPGTRPFGFAQDRFRVPGVVNEERGLKTEDHAISNSPPPIGGGREGAEDRGPKTEHHTISSAPPPIGGGREGAEEVLLSMSASRRRQIKNGLKSGAEIIEPENLKQLKAFYHILYALYRYKVNKPLPDWSFFSQFYKQTLKHWNTETLDHKNTETQKHNNSVGIIRLIQYKDKIIGGILAPIWQNKVIYEWYVCGLDHEYKAQYPSVLATWAAIDYAIENKIETFDFMGVGTPEKDYGVRDFKARFGGDMVNYGRFTRVNNKTLYGIAELGYNVLALFKKI